MDHVIEQQAHDSWDSFPLFQLLNDYLRNHSSLSEGKFHKHLQDIFAPLIIRYVDLMESSIGQSIHKVWACIHYLLGLISRNFFFIDYYIAVINNVASFF